MLPIDLIKSFDLILYQRNMSFEAVAIGGTALNLLGIVSRETKDCDILVPKIPEPILKAAKEFSESQNNLIPEWVNNGPESLRKNLPPGWELRLQPLFKGKAVTLQTLSRTDLLKIKLYAYCDRDTDFDDCIALKPTPKELSEALMWVQHQDGNTNWPEHVSKNFSKLAKRLGYEF